MPNIDIPLIEENIKKAGFVLEHQVTEKLRENGWSVINNKYYIDDVAESVREIDLIAYKATRTTYGGTSSEAVFWVYTTLIISCKKNEQNLWALLFRDWDEKNPNVNWHPAKIWTNHKVIECMTNKLDWLDNYLNKAKETDLYNEIFEPTGHLFAFQEIHKTNSTVQNDKKIYDSVSSLMKAESYEMNSLTRRKKEHAVYNFNLISILDTELLKMHFDGNSISSSLVDEAKSTINFIVNKNETSSRIHFCTFNNLDNCLKSYNNLHALNIDYFCFLYNDFYSNIFSDDRYRIFLEKFELITIPALLARVEKPFDSNEKFERYYSLSLNTDGILEIAVPSNFEEILNEMMKSSVPRSIVQNSLRGIFRYYGEFKFIDEDEIPF